MKLPPYLNITGYPAAYKSTVALKLSLTYLTEWYSRLTTGPFRLMSDINGQEYRRIADEVYDHLLKTGRILDWESARDEKVNSDGTVYRRGILHPKFRPKPRPNTQLRLSVYSPRLSPDLQRLLVPDMINVCLVADDEILIQRLIDRFGRDHVESHLKTIKQYRKDKIEDNFPPEYVIDTSFLSSVEVMRQIEELIGPQNLKR